MGVTWEHAEVLLWVRERLGEPVVSAKSNPSHTNPEETHPLPRTTAEARLNPRCDQRGRSEVAGAVLP